MSESNEASLLIPKTLIYDIHNETGQEPGRLRRKIPSTLAPVKPNLKRIFRQKTGEKIEPLKDGFVVFGRRKSIRKPASRTRAAGQMPCRIQRPAMLQQCWITTLP